MAFRNPVVFDPYSVNNPIYSGRVSPGSLIRVRPQTGGRRRKKTKQERQGNRQKRRRDVVKFLKDTKLLSTLGTAGLGIAGEALGGPLGGAAAASIGGFALRKTGFGTSSSASRNSRVPIRGGGKKGGAPPGH